MPLDLVSDVVEEGVAVEVCLRDSDLRERVQDDQVVQVDEEGLSLRL
eukprot:CAMPEP_0202850222 /NCGR_PEP_ID=MMETSP1389-20130828/83101_1 /ASSEMBLY_ACC=CAM_ASM_000865 /TAXON_ID=302021 /ORGANISM="Rhodomonas sp., Strain CCMP768" /LENGTH=46 /DNA_ID= /DNA_START= /DNA_END= /DNA_ORIENTATION=